MAMTLEDIDKAVAMGRMTPETANSLKTMLAMGGSAVAQANTPESSQGLQSLAQGLRDPTVAVPQPLQQQVQAPSVPLAAPTPALTVNVGQEQMKPKLDKYDDLVEQALKNLEASRKRREGQQ